ncbi:ABC transporter permease [Burkholderia vietnamiensis]|uniref:ABC transporter permease n=1 Tax=Burkholderia vietnamiensis TaxID=60552 RepID=UPI00158A2962|nr:ABC transporter permease [Burkholderia vietnamiensis]MBR7975156.1 ABC transporter permease [Burkholderia vietnamiensis]MBR8007559.1 ABC transporter permease [Burkholderia vietnamiensis]MCA8452139.1 ABC transporter permease [Burkholderia vietnamiensis]MDN7669720.1 ABC transporter permease [Burkholderia vietnamiensis]HDR8954519.1 ABC transporter permease [Burkholderia vietnamiensis]
MKEFVSAAKLWRVWLHMGLQDIKSRFRSSALGPGWILVNLAAVVGAVGLIYGRLFHQPMNEFLPFLTLGVVIWTFITSSLVEGAMAFVVAEGYIKQFPFPKPIYLYRALVPYAVVFSIGLIVYFIVVAFYHRHVGWGALWVIPGLVLFLAINFFHVVIVAHVGVRFRDLPHLLGSLMQIAFYLTPVIFTVGMLRDRGLSFVYAFNPLYYLIEILRYPLLNSAAAPPEVLYVALGYCVVVGILAMVVVKKMSKRIVYVL